MGFTRNLKQRMDQYAYHTEQAPLRQGRLYHTPYNELLSRYPSVDSATALLALNIYMQQGADKCTEFLNQVFHLDEPVKQRIIMPSKLNLKKANKCK